MVFAFILFLFDFNVLHDMAGAKVNVKDNSWLTALHYTAARGHEVYLYNPECYGHA